MSQPWRIAALQARLTIYRDNALQLLQFRLRDHCHANLQQLRHAPILRPRHLTERDDRRFAFAAELLQLFETLQRLLMAAEFQERIGVAEQDGRVLGPMAGYALLPLRFRIIPTAERRCGLRDAHAIADGRRVFERAHGVAIIALGVERLLRGAAGPDIGSTDNTKLEGDLAAALRLSVDVNKLAIGRYDCQVTVLDPKTKKAAFWQAPVVLVP